MDKRSDGGQWAFPGGQAEEGETPLECAKRELEEETGLANVHLEFVALFDNPGSIGAYDDGNVVLTHFSLFKAQLNKLPEVRPSEETLALRFVPLEELQLLDIAASHNPIVRWIDDHRSKDSL